MLHCIWYSAPTLSTCHHFKDDRIAFTPTSQYSLSSSQMHQIRTKVGGSADAFQHRGSTLTRARYRTTSAHDRNLKCMIKCINMLHRHVWWASTSLAIIFNAAAIASVHRGLWSPYSWKLILQYVKIKLLNYSLSLWLFHFCIIYTRGRWKINYELINIMKLDYNASALLKWEKVLILSDVAVKDCLEYVCLVVYN